MKSLAFLGTSGQGLPRVGRYELLAEIASGGMASVYLARLVGIGGFQRLFAIKRMHPHLAQETEFVKMFLDEARLVAGIRHPNVVPVLEVGADDGYYLVMEYVEGDMLASLLMRSIRQGGHVPLPVVISIILDTLAGLHAAHEHTGPDGRPVNIVHRDVSPQNILVDINGTTKITDFGIARATTRLSSTRGGQLKGKVAYMAPEQARGDPNIDRRADIFATGVVAWESLASRRLFMADNEVATLNRLMSEEIPNLHEVDSKIPLSIAGVVAKALQRDPTARYQTAAAMAQELREAARKSGVLGTPPDVAEFLNGLVGALLEQRRKRVREFLASLPKPVSETDFTTVPTALIKAPQPPGMVPTPTTPDSPGAFSANATRAEPSSIPGAYVPSPDTAALLRAAQRKSRRTMLIAVAASAVAAVVLAVVLMTTFGTKKALDGPGVKSSNSPAVEVQRSLASSPTSTRQRDDQSEDVSAPSGSAMPGTSTSVLVHASNSASPPGTTTVRFKSRKLGNNKPPGAKSTPVEEPNIHGIERNPYR